MAYSPNNEELLIFEIESESMLKFFDYYIDNCANKFTACKLAEVKYSQLLEWEKLDSFKIIKEAIDDLLLATINEEVVNQALSGSFKHAEFLLSGKDKKARVEIKALEAGKSEETTDVVAMALSKIKELSK